MPSPRLTLAAFVAYLPAFFSATAGCAGTDNGDGAGPSIGRAASPIIGGMPATQDQVYSAVAIMSTATMQPTVVGSGVLISPTVVVTAAHVLYNQGNVNLPLYNNQIAVIVGALDVTVPDAGQQVAVASLTPYPSYDGGTPSNNMPAQEGDIGVIVLAESVNTFTLVPTLPLAQFSNLTQGTPMTIEGYGVNDVGTEAQGVLYTAQSPYQSNNGFEVLVGNPGDPSICSGDSGGPAYVMLNGTMYLAGVASRSFDAPDGGPTCQAGSIYTILDAYTDWISANSGSTCSDSGAGGTNGGTNMCPAGSTAGCTCKVEGAPASSGLGWSLALGIAALTARRRRGAR